MRAPPAIILALLASAAPCFAQAPRYDAAPSQQPTQPAVAQGGYFPAGSSQGAILRPVSVGCTELAPQQPQQAPYGHPGQQPCGGPYLPGCQPPCLPPCPPCYPPGPPREAVPREAQPPAPTTVGNYVAPPPTGAIVGPERGYDLGGLSLVFPECKISLPRLHFSRGRHFFREGHMELDAARAAYVEHPFAAQFVQQQQEREAEPTPREAVPEKQPPQPREAIPQPGKPLPTPHQAPPVPAYDKGVHERLDRLEKGMRMQMEAMQLCVEQLKQMQQLQQQAIVPTGRYEPRPAALPQQASPQPLVPGDQFGRLRLAPAGQRSYSGVGPASYVQPVHGPHSIAEPIREPARN